MFIYEVHDIHTGKSTCAVVDDTQTEWNRLLKSIRTQLNGGHSVSLYPYDNDQHSHIPWMYPGLHK